MQTGKLLRISRHTIAEMALHCIFHHDTQFLNRVSLSCGGTPQR